MSDNQDIALRPNGGSMPVQTPTLAAGGLVSVEQQRALGELQAQIMLAKLYPRDQAQVIATLKRLDCTRPGLALESEYTFSRGGQDVSGPSIRLMEAIARRWGNLQSGIKEVSRGVDNDIGYSECVAYAWDLETGFRDERQFRVRHVRDTRRGQQKLTDERDVYELVANYGQRRKRSCLQAVIPGDVVEEVAEECRKTLNAEANTGPEAIKRLLAAFAEFSVTQRQIERRIQRNIDAIRPAQVVQLRKVYASLKDGMTTVENEFEATEPEPRPTRQPPQRTQASATQEPPKEPPAPPETPPEPPPPAPQPEPPAAVLQSADEPPLNGNGNGDIAFEHVLLDVNGEPVDGEVHLDPFRYAQGFLELWRDSDSDSALTLIEQNRDGIEDACRLDEQAAVLLDGLNAPPAEVAESTGAVERAAAPQAPAESTADADDKDVRAANSMIVHVSGLQSAAAVIEYSKSPAVLVPIQRWQREGREDLVARVKAMFTKRLEETRNRRDG